VEVAILCQIWLLRWGGGSTDGGDWLKNYIDRLSNTMWF